MDGFDGLVGVSVDRENGSPGVAFGLFIIEGWVVDEVVVPKCLFPDRFDVTVFGFR